MDIQEIRRARLRQWLEGKTAPSKEKSYFSQLLGGTSSFGERAARRLERDYGMGEGYLDQPLEVITEPVKPKSGADQIETKLNRPSSAAAYNGLSGTPGATEATVGEPLSLPRGRDIPVVGEAMGGPDGYISINDYVGGHGDGWIHIDSADPNAYALKVRGDSMRPRIRSGEYIVVEPSVEAQPGDDVVVKFLDGSAVVKELMWIRDDEVCLGSVNNGIPPITRPLSEILTIHRVEAIIPRGSRLHRPALY